MVSFSAKQSIEERFARRLTTSAARFNSNEYSVDFRQLLRVVES